MIDRDKKIMANFLAYDENVQALKTMMFEVLANTDIKAGELFYALEKAKSIVIDTKPKKEDKSFI